MHSFPVGEYRLRLLRWLLQEKRKSGILDQNLIMDCSLLARALLLHGKIRSQEVQQHFLRRKMRRFIRIFLEKQRLLLRWKRRRRLLRQRVFMILQIFQEMRISALVFLPNRRWILCRAFMNIIRCWLIQEQIRDIWQRMWQRPCGNVWRRLQLVHIEALLIQC